MKTGTPKLLKHKVDVFSIHDPYSILLPVFAGIYVILEFFRKRDM